MNENVLSVSQMCAAMENVLKNDFPNAMWVQGEVLDLKKSANGHFYFMLTDGHAALSCVIWANTYAPSKYRLQNGNKIEIAANWRFYNKRGTLQLNVQSVRQAGLGAQKEELARLKAQLEKEGLFLLSRKKPLPFVMLNVAIVTSQSGDAVHDILARFRGLPICTQIFNAQVQGDLAPDSLVLALKQADNAGCDVIILSRGGGASSDLSAFDHENVVRTFAHLKTPTISGIGHEADVSLCDFVADERASTPTDAAMRVRQRLENVLNALLFFKNQLRILFEAQLKQKQEKLWQLAHQMAHLSPNTQLARQKLILARFQFVLPQKINAKYEHMRQQCFLFKEKMALMNPNHLLKRGYALILDENKKLIFDGNRVKKGAFLHVKMAHTTLKVRVENVLEENK